MNPYHRFHRRFHAKRQGLSGILGGLAGPSSRSTSSSAGSQPTDGGIIGEITSLFGGFATVSSSTPLTPSSSSSTGSTTTSHSTTSASSITSSTPPALTTPATTPTPTSSAHVVLTSSDGTSIVYITSTPPVASATSSPHLSFLENPSLEGGVFTLVGLVILIIIFLLLSWTIRKRRRDRLERESAAAISFDPGATAFYERQEETMEKRRLSMGSSGHDHGYVPGYSMPQMAYAQQEYHPQSYGHYPAVSYCPPSILYQVAQPAGQGGANLTRKFSDRKPVPPLFPEPAHDPANTSRAYIPPQVYQQ